MKANAKTMREFYASFGIKIDNFIAGFSEVGFEYFYENVILKTGKKPDVKYVSYEIELDKSYEFGFDVTGYVYELKHMFVGLEVSLEYTFIIECREICNMHINYTTDSNSGFIDSNFYNEWSADCDKLLKMLRNAKLKALIDIF
jgi:hypothetical protein